MCNRLNWWFTAIGNHSNTPKIYRDFRQFDCNLYGCKHVLQIEIHSRRLKFEYHLHRNRQMRVLSQNLCVCVNGDDSTFMGSSRIHADAKMYDVSYAKVRMCTRHSSTMNTSILMKWLIDLSKINHIFGLHLRSNHSIPFPFATNIHTQFIVSSFLYYLFCPALLSNRTAHHILLMIFFNICQVY